MIDGKSANIYNDLETNVSRKRRLSMINIPAGTYQIGTNHPGFATDNEGPPVTIEQPQFMIDATTVTNREFAAFVEATGYVTEAERFGWSFVFHYFVSE